MTGTFNRGPSCQGTVLAIRRVGGWRQARWAGRLRVGGRAGRDDAHVVKTLAVLWGVFIGAPPPLGSLVFAHDVGREHEGEILTPNPVQVHIAVVLFTRRASLVRDAAAGIGG